MTGCQYSGKTTLHRRDIRSTRRRKSVTSTLNHRTDYIQNRSLPHQDTANLFYMIQIVILLFAVIFNML